jgi:hypothetical protein
MRARICTVPGAALAQMDTGRVSGASKDKKDKKDKKETRDTRDTNNAFFAFCLLYNTGHRENKQGKSSTLEHR